MDARPILTSEILAPVTELLDLSRPAKKRFPLLPVVTPVYAKSFLRQVKPPKDFSVVPSFQLDSFVTCRLLRAIRKTQLHISGASLSLIAFARLDGARLSKRTTSKFASLEAATYYFALHADVSFP